MVVILREVTPELCEMSVTKARGGKIRAPNTNLVGQPLKAEHARM